MAFTTIEQFATELRMPSGILLEQLKMVKGEDERHGLRL